MKRDVMAREGESLHEGACLSDDVQAKIGSQLKSIYDTVLDEPVPDRLAGLLRQLEEAGLPDSNRGRG